MVASGNECDRISKPEMVGNKRQIRGDGVGLFPSCFVSRPLIGPCNGFLGFFERRRDIRPCFAELEA